MALPVTLPATFAMPQQNSYVGPFKSSENAFYGSARSGSQCRVVKATDPTVSFAIQDILAEPDFVVTILSLNTFQVNDKLHIAGQNSSDDVYYARFNMFADTWDEITVGNTEDLVDGAPDGTLDACDLIVRSDADIAIVYQGVTESIMGQPNERVHLAVSTDGGDTWTAGTRVDNQGKVERDFSGPRIVLGDSDTSHIVWIDQSSPRTMSQRALSSADSLQTERTDITGADDISAAVNYVIGHGVSFNRAGTTKIRFPYADVDNDLGVLEFDAVADPSSFSISSNIDGTNNVQHSISKLLCLATDGSIVYETHNRATDNDLYTANDQNTDTWTSPTNIFTGTINRLSSNIYDRATGPILAHIIDDAGATKYDEDTITHTHGTLSGVDFPDQNYFVGPFEI